MSLLWSRLSTTRIFDWSSILTEWNNSFTMPVYVEIVMANLKEASNPGSSYDPTIEQFLRYFNHEQSAIAWFLFENVTHRWMWSTPRLDYVRELVDHVENLDGYFPDFPGSPGRSQTIRQWLTANLDDDELEYVEMMPALVNQPQAQSYAQPQTGSNWVYETPTRPTRPASTNAPGRRSSLPENTPRYATIQFRLLREENNKGDTDDVININKVAGDLYDVVYNDQNGSVKMKTQGLTQGQVQTFLSNTFRLLTVDNQPFHNVQVILPGLPSIMVAPEDLDSQTRDLIYDSVEMTMENWPILA
jgi:hypothetical protein